MRVDVAVVVYVVVLLRVEVVEVLVLEIVCDLCFGSRAFSFELTRRVGEARTTGSATARNANTPVSFIFASKRKLFD